MDLLEIEQLRFLRYMFKKIRLCVGVRSVDGHASRRQVPLAGHIRASPVKYPPAEMQRQDC